MMNVKDLITLLEVNKDAALYMMLPGGEFIPEHFHITEIGRIQKNFIDCGGVIRKSSSCLLQVWYSHDVEHRLVAGKLVEILKLGEKMFDLNELPMVIEYGVDVVSHYILSDVEVTSKGLLFVLVGKQTACLAPDKCGVTKC